MEELECSESREGLQRLQNHPDGSFWGSRYQIVRIGLCRLLGQDSQRLVPSILRLAISILTASNGCAKFGPANVAQRVKYAVHQ